MSEARNIDQFSIGSPAKPAPSQDSVGKFLPLISLGPALTPTGIESFRKQLQSSPLAVYRQPGTFIPIPASSTPLLMAAKRWQQLQQDCNAILAAMQKLVSYLRTTTSREFDKYILGELSPLEKTYALNGMIQSLATVRFDLFFDDDDLKILEVNTTIPAMQAYSDMVCEAFLNCQKQRDYQFRSNSNNLLRDLINSYQSHPRSSDTSSPKIAIIARQGDSQLAELQWLAKIWQKSGHSVTLCQPENFKTSNGKMTVDNKKIDLVYRHIFASGLDPQSAFARALLEPQYFPIFNTISGHFEVKALMSFLSQMNDEPTLAQKVGLTTDEQSAIQQRIPWTRMIRKTGVAADAHLKKRLLDDRNNLVIKSSHGYGGHQVILGETFHDDTTQAQLRTIFLLSRDISWEDFINHLFSTPQTWIAQQRIAGKKMRLDIIRGEKCESEEVYIDCSLFTSSLSPLETGGTVRFAPNPIVNIAQGGGLAPLFFV